MQEFLLDKKFTSLMKGCLFVFAAFFALGVSLPFLPAEEGSDPKGTLWVAVLCCAVFGVFIVVTLWTIRKLPYCDLVTDEGGIWYKHLGKEEGFISWDRIAAIDERQYSQCIALLDAAGNELIRAEYQLSEFSALRELNKQQNRCCENVSRPDHFQEEPSLSFVHACRPDRLHFFGPLCRLVHQPPY